MMLDENADHFSCHNYDTESNDARWLTLRADLRTD